MVESIIMKHCDKAPMHVMKAHMRSAAGPRGAHPGGYVMD